MARNAAVALVGMMTLSMAAAVVPARTRIADAMAATSVRVTSNDTVEGVVVTPLGPVQGLVSDRARAFLGVPFAMPPVGPLRWQPPQPAVAWGPTVLQGIYDPTGCIQACDGGEPPHVCPGYTDENCLLLNVWTPRASSLTEQVPVIVFIHGGNFRSGYAGGVEYGIVYDATDFVNNTGAILVSIQYRLGALGFLYAGNSTGLSGNYGLMDQEMAFNWVKQNIASFGGDPTRVTISGQSAGAMSVASHLSRPSSAGLYQGAIMHSEPFALPFRDVASGVEMANVFAQQANCSDGSGNNWPAVEACLRAANASTLLAAQVATQGDVAADITKILQVFMPFTPTYGTPYLPLTPYDAFRAGSAVDVPTIIGTVGNEADLFIYSAFGKNMSETEYLLVLGVILGLGDLGPVLSQYPTPTSPPPDDYRPYVSTLGSDVLFVCSTRNASRSVLASQRTSPLFLYQYTHHMSWSASMWGPQYPFSQCIPRVCHGSDLPSFFHPNYPAFGTNYTAAENSMSADMQMYWAQFAATGAPGSVAGLAWPALTEPSRQSLMIDSPYAVVSDAHAAICDFWDSLGYNYY